MALELRQQLKLTQQLVMTPQLQQAIKLLQLSRLELVNAVQEELVENPCLDEVTEDEATPAQTEAEEPSTPEEPSPSESSEDAAEPTAEEMISDVDWESYMESRPQTSLARADDERPPLEDRIAPGTSLQDHLLWTYSITMKWQD